MEMMIDRTADKAEKYELKSDGIAAEIGDKLFIIFTYGPDDRYYLADIHAGKIVAAISMDEGFRCVLTCDEAEGWKITAIDENGKRYGSIQLCRTGIDPDSMTETSRNRTSKTGDVPILYVSDFKEADDHGTGCRRDRDLRQNDKRA